ncbi:MAG: histidine kinase [Betaproteobacteria bacterium]
MAPDAKNELVQPVSSPWRRHAWTLAAATALSALVAALTLSLLACEAAPGGLEVTRAGVGALLVAGFGLLFLATRAHLSADVAMKLDARRLVVESQLRLLRAQLEPHMMFNTLANLRSLLREDAGQAEAMIDRLVTYLRSALTASCAESTTLGHEFAQLRAYLEIMAFRMGPRLAYRLDLPVELTHVLVPPMLLQPLVENAIRHGLEPKVGVGRVDVLARQVDAGVEISVTDSGLGLPCDADLAPKEAADSTLHGLSHVRARLSAAYGSRASLHLQGCKPCGVCAVVIIPA